MRGGLKVDTAAASQQSHVAWLKSQSVDEIAARFRTVKLKSDDLFLTWINQPCNKEFVKNLVDAYNKGEIQAVAQQISQDTQLNNKAVSSPRTLSSPRSMRGISGLLSPLGMQSPPLSPKFRPTRSPRRRSSPLTPTNDTSQSPSPTFRESRRRQPRAAQVMQSPPVSPVGMVTEKLGLVSLKLRDPPVEQNNNAEIRLPSARKAAGVPKFYFPGEGGRGRGKPITGDSLEAKRSDIESAFQHHPNGVLLGQFINISSNLCNIPVFCNALLFRRVRWHTLRWEAAKVNVLDKHHTGNRKSRSQKGTFNRTLFRHEGKESNEKSERNNAVSDDEQLRISFTEEKSAFESKGWTKDVSVDGKNKSRSPLSSPIRAAVKYNGNNDNQCFDLDLDPFDSELERGVIRLDDFLQYWKLEMEPYDTITRFFRLLARPGNNYFDKDDLMPLTDELLHFHPGLELLESTPEFQDSYQQTVIARVMYKVNTSETGQITLRELRNSNFVEMCDLVDRVVDINKVTDYFSYQHFYVLYCKFWELDTDHDFLISKEDLIKHDGHALTSRIVDRVFQGAARPLQCKVPGMMGYEDFIYFFLSEEDKTNRVSLRYWFRCIDLDSSGTIEPWEMKHFFSEQLRRSRCLGQEEVSFENILCQLHDCIHPEVEGKFTLKDFVKPSKINTSGVFFNVLFNLNKFNAFEQRDPFASRGNDDDKTEWDRYAREEFERLYGQDGNPASDDEYTFDEYGADGEPVYADDCDFDDEEDDDKVVGEWSQINQYTLSSEAPF